MTNEIVPVNDHKEEAPHNTKEFKGYSIESSVISVHLLHCVRTSADPRWFIMPTGFANAVSSVVTAQPLELPMSGDLRPRSFPDSVISTM